MRGEPQLAHRVIVFDIIQLYAISLKLSDFPEECLHCFLWSFAPEVRKNVNYMYVMHICHGRVLLHVYAPITQ